MSEAMKRVTSMYFQEDDKEIMTRLDALAEAMGGRYSRSALVVCCVKACIDTLEKEAPKKRQFILNGKEIRL